MLVPVFVIEPASQSEHDGTFDAVEYLPAAHAVHVVAPVLLPLFVIEPASHMMQSLNPVVPTYIPATHATQRLVVLAFVMNGIMKPARHTQEYL